MTTKDIFSKILFVGPDYKQAKGGMAMVLNSYASFIKPFKFVRTYASDLTNIAKFWYAISGYVKLFWLLLTDKNIQIVHVHSASGTSFWRKSHVIDIAKFFGKQVIFHCHGGGFREFRLKEPAKVDAVLAKCDMIVCLSQEWEEYFKGIGCKDVCSIKNVITQPVQMDIEPDGKVHFLFLGLICDNKGIFDILRALNEHKSEVDGKIMLHVGGNGEVERLKQYIADNQLEKIVSFEGWVDKEKKVRLLNRADVYILPSYIEGVPISILEAESYRKPVITSNVGGIPSIVCDGKSGFFVTPGNSEEIFDVMMKLATNPQLREAMGIAGYEISKDYLPDTISKELNSLYCKMLFCKKNKKR